MKKYLASLFTVLVLAGAASAEKADDHRERFYGKIISVDQSRRALTVHNAKQKLDATFQWDDTTGLLRDKKPIEPAELKVGQSLIVSYVADNNVNRAKRITVRTPFKKAAANP